MRKLIDTSALIEDLRRGVFEGGAISVITLIEVLRARAKISGVAALMIPSLTAFWIQACPLFATNCTVLTSRSPNPKACEELTIKPVTGSREVRVLGMTQRNASTKANATA
jgi:hypothetical protein